MARHFLKGDAAFKRARKERLKGRASAPSLCTLIMNVKARFVAVD